MCVLSMAARCRFGSSTREDQIPGSTVKKGGPGPGDYGGTLPLLQPHAVHARRTHVPIGYCTVIRPRVCACEPSDVCTREPTCHFRPVVLWLFTPVSRSRAAVMHRHVVLSLKLLSVCIIAAAEGVSAMGTIPVSTMKSAPRFGFGTSTKIGEKPSGTPGPGSYPIMSAIGPYVIFWKRW